MQHLRSSLQIHFAFYSTTNSLHGLDELVGLAGLSSSAVDFQSYRLRGSQTENAHNGLGIDLVFSVGKVDGEMILVGERHKTFDIINGLEHDLKCLHSRDASCKMGNRVPFSDQNIPRVSLIIPQGISMVNMKYRQILPAFSQPKFFNLSKKRRLKPFFCRRFCVKGCFPMMMKVSAITLGCKVNQYETQAMLAKMTAAGFGVCAAGEPADVVLINSCTVTAASDHKVRQTLHRARKNNPDAVLVLTGCMPQAFPEAAAALEDADVVLGNSNRGALVPDILKYLSTHQRVIDIVPHETGEAFEALQVESFFERTRAFVKIQDGCNRLCSYCIIPYARGRIRSKPLEELKTELAALGKNGYREVVLTGINLSAYGQELGLHLCDAVEAACAVPEIARSGWALWNRNSYRTT